MTGDIKVTFTDGTSAIWRNAKLHGSRDGWISITDQGFGTKLLAVINREQIKFYEEVS